MRAVSVMSVLEEKVLRRGCVGVVSLSLRSGWSFLSSPGCVLSLGLLSLFSQGPHERFPREISERDFQVEVIFPRHLFKHISKIYFQARYPTENSKEDIGELSQGLF